MMHDQAQGSFVHPVALGKGEGFAYEAARTLTQRVVPTFDVAGFACALAARAVGAPGKDLVVSQPPVAARGAAAIIARDALAQGTGTGQSLIGPAPAERSGSLRPFAFSRDGTRLLTGLESFESETTLRTLPVSAEPLPEWFLALEEAAAGWRLNADGQPETVDRRTVYALREAVLARPDAGFAVHVAKQFLGAYKTPLAPLSAKAE